MNSDRIWTICRALQALATRHWPAIVIGTGALILELGGDAGRLAARFDRAALDAGELWRLATGQLVHLGWSHLFLNLAGLTVLSALFGKDVRPLAFAGYFVAGMAAVDAGLWFFATDVQWYVGLSGALHGIWAGGAITVVHNGERRFGAALGALLALKLAVEQATGALPLTEGISGGTVIQIAHLFGATGGFVAAVLFLTLAVACKTARQRQL